MASLRVLGFTRARSRHCCSANLLAVVLIAQPLGWLIGYGFACRDGGGLYAPSSTACRWSSIARSMPGRASWCSAAAAISGLVVRRRDRPAGHDRSAEDEGMTCCGALQALAISAGRAGGGWPGPSGRVPSRSRRRSSRGRHQGDGGGGGQEPHPRGLHRLGTHHRADAARRSHAGDAVEKDETVVATLRPVTPDLLDARALRVAEAASQPRRRAWTWPRRSVAGGGAAHLHAQRA